jgi:two-component sensor histidine kinase
VSLASPTQTTLGPYLGARDRIRLVVRDVRLNPDFALTLALGLNELATNAAKYGALASPAGRITLTARVETGRMATSSVWHGRMADPRWTPR